MYLINKIKKFGAENDWQQWQLVIIIYQAAGLKFFTLEENIL